MIISTADQTTNTIRQAKWDGEGILATNPTTPAITLFEEADALFQVEKRELQYPRPNCFDSTEEVMEPAGIYGIVRTDTNALLGAVTKQYEIVQNDSLLRMAEFIREEVEMDSVFVLGGGSKVCFTANVRGAEADIVPGDTIKRRIVGYLGHDGKTGCGAMFTNIRVVCSNTLATARKDASASASIRHKNGANQNFDSLIQSIDVARQDFVTECDLMREFSQRGMSQSQFTEFVNELYSVKEGGVFRKRTRLEDAFQHGLGWHHAPKSIWSAVNAVTQVETSTRQLTARSAIKQFQRANFGSGLTMSQKAMALAEKLVTAWTNKGCCFGSSLIYLPLLWL